MSLTEEQSNLSQEVKEDYERIFNFNEFEVKNNESSELINIYDNNKEIEDENIDKLEKNNIYNTKEEINNSNKNDNKLETNIIENTLLNSNKNNYILVESNNLKKQHFIITTMSNDQNSNNKNKNSLYNKRGRPKKSDDKRNHTKYHKDNIEAKIKGIVINSTLSFINNNIDDQSKKLKVLSPDETIKLKINMNKNLKDIYMNVSTRFKNDYNKNIISSSESKLKRIFELPMYKIIHHISGKDIGILMGLEEEYLSLKNKKLEKENGDYKKLFNKIEAEFLNLIKKKYPINDEITLDNTFNSKNNVNQNFIFSNNNDQKEEKDLFSLEMLDNFNNNNINDSNAYTIFPSNYTNEKMDEVLSFSEC